jgi:hypothetical protein
MRIPTFNLTHGQVLFALSDGRTPERQLVNQLRHLRRLNVPFPAGEVQGQGNRVHYSFEELIETGAAVFALRNHMPPRAIAEWFDRERTTFRKTCRTAWRSLPDGSLDQVHITKRGIAVRSDEIYIRLHDRYAQSPGMFELVQARDMIDVFKNGFVGERFDDQQFRPMFALKDSMLRWVFWARKAPVIRTGPK